MRFKSDLKNKSRAELSQAFAAIPNNVTSLDLSANRLGYINNTAILFFAAIPNNVTSLDLSANRFGYIDNMDIPEDNVQFITRAS